MNRYLVRVECKGHGANAEIFADNERQASFKARRMLSLQACINTDKVKVRKIKLVEG
jgi:hypothetical protein